MNDVINYILIQKKEENKFRQIKGACYDCVFFW